MSTKPLIRFEAVSGNIVLGGRQFLLFDVRKTTENPSPRAGAEVKEFCVRNLRNGKPETREGFTADAQWNVDEIVGQRDIRTNTTCGEAKELGKNVSGVDQSTQEGQYFQAPRPKNKKTLLAAITSFNDQKHVVQQKGTHELDEAGNISHQKDDDIQICYDARRAYTATWGSTQRNVDQKSAEGVTALVSSVDELQPWTPEASKRVKLGDQSRQNFNQRDQLPMTTRNVKIGDVIHEGMKNGAKRRTFNVGGGFPKQEIRSGTSIKIKDIHPAMAKDSKVIGGFFNQGLSSETTTNAKDVHSATERNGTVKWNFLKEGIPGGTTINEKVFHPTMGRNANVKGGIFMQGLISGTTVYAQDARSLAGMKANVRGLFVKQGLQSGTTNNANDVHPPTRSNANIKGGFLMQELSGRTSMNAKDVYPAINMDVDLGGGFLREEFPSRSIVKAKGQDPQTGGDISVGFVTQDYPTGSITNVKEQSTLTGRSISIEDFLAQAYLTESFNNVNNEGPTARPFTNVGRLLVKRFEIGSTDDVKEYDGPAKSKTIEVGDCVVRGSVIESTESVSYVLPESAPTGSFTSVANVPTSGSGVNDRNGDHAKAVSNVAFCTICQVPWRSRSALQIHHQNIHLKFECRVCASYHSFQVGRIRHTTAVEATTCFLCAVIFADKDALKDHFYEHKATDAGKEDSRPEERLAPVPVGDPWAPPVTCGICGVVLESKADRDTHMSRDHGFTYACGICFERFETLVSLSLHEDLHSRRLTKLHSKPEIPEQARTRSGRFAHAPKHLPDPRGCAETQQQQQLGSIPEIPERARTRSGRFAHAPKHLRDPRGCAETQQQQLGSIPEMPERTRERLYFLDAPEQQYDGNSPQVTDSKINYMCNFCDQLFGTWGELLSHRQKHSNTTCFLCMTSFSSYKDFNSHISLNCEMCKATFCSREQLDSHYQVHNTQTTSQLCNYPQFV